MPKREVVLELDGHEVRVTNPDKVFFPQTGHTKLDVVNYFVELGEAALRGVYLRPMLLKRYVNGVEEEPFFQKRVPPQRPDWIESARIRFPSGRSADMMVSNEVADLAWAANLGCVDLNPWPVRAEDVDHPDELRLDLDPTPEATWDDVRRVALVANEVLQDFGYRGYPKTSGSRGIHVLVRIEAKWEFDQLRRSALAVGREMERRAPELITTRWWKEERHGVFIDYNQNARDRTLAAAYSVRPLPDARVSTPLDWSEVATVDPAAFTLATVPTRVREVGDPQATIDEVAHSLEPLLELVARQEAEGLGDAAYPPQFPKAEGEPPRVQPSRARDPNAPKRPARRRPSRAAPKTEAGGES